VRDRDATEEGFVHRRVLHSDGLLGHLACSFRCSPQYRRVG
jgi:hypothetical protein